MTINSFGIAYLMAVLYFSFFSVSLLGWGTLLLLLQKKIVNNTFEKRTVLLATGIYGFIVVYLLGTIANFFIPLNLYFSNALLICGCILLIYNKRMFLDHYAKKDYILIGISFAVIICTLSIFSTTVYNGDFNLYHMQTIKWIASQKLPLGLANLHGRFGFNVSWHLIMAVLEQPLLITGRALFISLPILLFYCLSSVLIVLCNIGKRLMFSDLFFLLSAIVMIINLPQLGVQAEFVILIIGFVLLFFLFRILESEQLTFSDDAFFLVLGAVFFITIKISSFAFAACCILFILIYGCIKRAYVYVKGLVITTIISGITILLPMIMRSVLLSGCIVYPVPFLRINSLKWAVPYADVQSEKNWITSWARMPGDNFAYTIYSNEWLEQWLHNFFNNTDIKLLIGLLLLSLLLFAYRLLCIPSKKNRNDLAKYLLVAIIPMSGVVFWLVTAPDIRFGLVSLYAFPMIVLTSAIYSIYMTSFKKKHMTIALSMAIIMLIALPNLGHLLNHFLRYSPVHAASLTTDYYQELNGVEIIEKKTTEGFIVYTPSKGDQTYNMPLPATPYFDPNLKIKRDENGNYIMFYFEE